MLAAKVIAFNSRCVAAITLTVPEDRLFWCATDRAKRDEATKTLTCNVFSVFAEGDKRGARGIIGVHQKFLFW